MTHDIHVLTTWIRVVALITAACTTSVPILYSFSPWRSTVIGRLFMLNALSFAAVMDLIALFFYWHPTDILVVFWTDAFVLTMSAGSTLALTLLMWQVNFSKKGKKREIQ